MSPHTCSIHAAAMHAESLVLRQFTQALTESATTRTRERVGVPGQSRLHVAKRNRGGGVDPDRTPIPRVPRTAQLSQAAVLGSASREAQVQLPVTGLKTKLQICHMYKSEKDPVHSPWLLV